MFFPIGSQYQAAGSYLFTIATYIRRQGLASRQARLSGLCRFFMGRDGGLALKAGLVLGHREL